MLSQNNGSRFGRYVQDERSITRSMRNRHSRLPWRSYVAGAWKRRSDVDRRELKHLLPLKGFEVILKALFYFLELDLEFRVIWYRF